MRILLAWLLFVFLCPSPSNSHATGNSKIGIKLIGPDSVTVLVDINRDDMLNVIQETESLAKADSTVHRKAYEKIAYYLKTRMRLDFDGKTTLIKVYRWAKDTKPGEIPDSAAMWASNYEIELKGARPPDSQRLNFNSTLYGEFGIQPITEVSVISEKDTLYRRFLAYDVRAQFELSPDSITAARNKSKAVASGDLARESIFGRFMALGYTHILPHGLDHILFVLGLFFFSTLMRPLLMQVTAFTIAHSITLALSLIGIFSLPAAIVEPLIALSITFVAVENLFMKRLAPHRWIVVFFFGLIHGLGFAGVLRELGIPAGQFWSGLIAFNLGVEGGQLTVIILGLLTVGWFFKKPWYSVRIAKPISVLIGAVGFYWTLQRIIGW